MSWSITLSRHIPTHLIVVLLRTLSSSRDRMNNGSLMSSPCSMKGHCRPQFLNWPSRHMEHILLDNLVRVFGIYEICFGRTPSLLCHAWYRDLALAPGAPIPGRSGLSIYVLARPRPVPLPPPDNREPDSNSLLALSLRSVSSPASVMPPTKERHWNVDTTERLPARHHPQSVNSDSLMDPVAEVQA